MWGCVKGWSFWGVFTINSSGTAASVGHKIKSWGIRANDQKWCERSALEVVVQPLTTDTIAVAVVSCSWWCPVLVVKEKSSEEWRKEKGGWRQVRLLLGLSKRRRKKGEQCWVSCACCVRLFEVGSWAVGSGRKTSRPGPQEKEKERKRKQSSKLTCARR